jgi:hypothetical protein
MNLARIDCLEEKNGKENRGKRNDNKKKNFLVLLRKS